MPTRNSFITLVILLGIVFTGGVGRAQSPAPPPAQYGLVQGTIVGDDGLPFANSAVRILAGDRTLTLTTTAAGTFLGTFPAGELAVQIMQTTRTLTVLAGELVTVRIAIPRPGIVVTLTGPEAVPTGHALYAAYKSPTREQSNLSGVALGANRYWFTQIPPDATAVSMILQVHDGRVGGHYQQQWSFDAPAEHRTLTMTIPAPVSVTLPLVTDGDVPLSEAYVTGWVRYSLPSPAPWQAAATAQQTVQNITPITTDARGMLTLERIAPQNYELRLQVGIRGGETLPLTIAPDGTLTPTRYLIPDVYHDVTQTIFDLQRRPLPAARVTACYTWGKRPVVREAVADGQGQVRWTQLPPVSVLVTGTGVLPGVLSATITQAPSPLPPPPERTNGSFHLTFTPTPPQGTRLLWRLHDTTLHERHRVGEVRVGTAGQFLPSGALLTVLPIGRPSGVVLLAEMTPLHLGTIDLPAIPYPEQWGQPVPLAVTLRPVVPFRLRIKGVRLPAGLPLELLPGPALADFPFQAYQDGMSALKAPVLTIDARGELTGSVPVPGDYRLQLRAGTTTGTVAFTVDGSGRPLTVPLPSALRQALRAFAKQPKPPTGLPTPQPIRLD
jgi:hypothetical protein